MPRTARLKEHEGRTLPDLTTPPQPSASNGPDRDEFLFSIGHQRKLQQAIDEAKAVLKKFRNNLKLRGFNLAMMDAAIDEAEREDSTTISNMRELKRYYEFMGLPIGHQFTLFDAPQEANSNGYLMAKAFAEGRDRGVRGEFPDEQKWLPVTPEGQEHQRGWQEGQQVHLAKFKTLEQSLAEAEKLAQAKAAKKAAKAKAKAEAEEDDEDEDETEEDLGPADEEPAPQEEEPRRRGAQGAH